MARYTDIRLDCQFCGACCKNSTANQAEGYVDYVPMEKGDAILQKPELMRRYGVLGKGGAWYLALTSEGRCKALRGALGGRVRCEIYHYRPSPCRRVQLGTELCRRYRRDHGLETEVR